MQSRLRWRRALGRNQFVDARAQILQHEILLGRRLTVVDLLGPLLERQLDAERLVDGEGDVQEIQAVDAEVVDRMAFGRDFLAVDVTGFGNDVGDGVESRGHRQPSENAVCFWQWRRIAHIPRTEAAAPIRRLDRAVPRIAKRSGEFNGGPRRAGTGPAVGRSCALEHVYLRRSGFYMLGPARCAGLQYYFDILSNDRVFYATELIP